MRKEYRLEIRVLIGIVIMLLLTGTMFYHKVEGLNYTDAFYMSSITLTTVGYGDFAPQTNAGKIFTSIYVLFGVGLLLESLSLLSKMRIQSQVTKARAKKQKRLQRKSKK